MISWLGTLDTGHFLLLTSSLGQCLGRTDWGKVKTRLTSFNSDDEMGQGQKKLTRYNRFQNWIFHLTMRYSEIRFDAWTTFFVDSSTILNLIIIFYNLNSSHAKKFPDSKVGRKLCAKHIHLTQNTYFVAPGKCFSYFDSWKILPLATSDKPVLGSSSV